jgi:hypothetical protein
MSPRQQVRSGLFGVFAIVAGLFVLLALAAMPPQSAEPPSAEAATCNPYTTCRGISKWKGLDTCAAPSLSVMYAWWNYSPYYDMGIYIGGSNRACSQPNLTSNWVQTSQGYGWDFYLTWVGPQSQCAGGGPYSTYINSNTTVAYQQGVGEAAAAQQYAQNLGLQGYTVFYYDLESYNSGNTACRNSVRSFLDGWGYMMAYAGHLSGVYGSPCNATDWVTIPHVPSDVWLADWNGDPDVWGLACGFPNGYWSYDQRIHQYSGNVWESYGGYGLNIDRDCADAPVAPNGHSGGDAACTVE